MQKLFIPSSVPSNISLHIPRTLPHSPAPISATVKKHIIPLQLDLRLLLSLRVRSLLLNWELSRLDNLDSLLWLVAVALWNVLDGLDDLVALDDLAEDDVLAVQPARIVLVDAIGDGRAEWWRSK